MAKLKQKRVVAVKHETTIGTAIAVDATDAAFNAYDVSTNMTAELTERMMTGYFSRHQGSLGNFQAVVTFKTELTGNGSGASNAWLDVLLPCAGMIETTDTFSPNSAAPLTTTGTGVNHTATVVAYEDGVAKTVVGCMANVIITGQSGKPVELEWTFMGKWASAVADTAILAPTLPTLRPVVFADATYTIGAASVGCLGNFKIDLGNQVTLLPCAGDATGFEHAIISGRQTTGSIDPESRLVATGDVFGQLKNGSELAFSLAMNGVDASGSTTDVITFAGPAIQYASISDADRNGIDVDQIEFNFNGSTGDDELTIDFS